MSNLLDMTMDSNENSSTAEIVSQETSIVVKVTDPDNFLKLTDAVAGFCAKNDTVPVLTGLNLQIKKEVPKRTESGLIKVPGNALFLIASDGTHTLAKGVASEEGQKSVVEADQELQVLIPARSFVDLLKRLPKGELTLHFKNDRVMIRAGKSEFEIMLLPIDQYPPVAADTAKPLMVPAKTLCSELRNAIYATDSKNSNSPLIGVHMKSTEKGLLIEACDRGSAAMSLLNYPSEGIDAILTRDTIKEITSVFDKADGPASISFGAATITINGSGSTLIVRPLDAKYPDLSKVVPTQFVSECILETEELLNAFERSILFVGDKVDKKDREPVLITLKDTSLRLLAKGVFGKGDENLTASSASGEIKIAVDSVRMRDAIRSFEEYQHIRVKFVGENASIYLEPIVDGEALPKLALVQPVMSKKV